MDRRQLKRQARQNLPSSLLTGLIYALIVFAVLFLSFKLTAEGTAKRATKRSARARCSEISLLPRVSVMRETEGSTTMPTATPKRATGSCQRWKALESAVTEPGCR